MADTDLIERATKAIDLFDAICNIHDPSVSAHDRRVRAMAKVLEAAQPPSPDPGVVTEDAVRLAGDILMSHGLNAPEQVIYRAAREVLETASLAQGGDATPANPAQVTERAILALKLRQIPTTNIGDAAVIGEAAEALTSAIGAGGQAVEPLEWEDGGQGCACKAETAFGTYEVYLARDGYRPVYFNKALATPEPHPMGIPAAKAAAQADYERRIKSALVGGEK